MNAPCSLPRRQVPTSARVLQHLQVLEDYDVFFRQKCDTFSRSGTAVFEHSTRFAEPFAYEEGATEEQKLKARELLFHETHQVCLWGNATDLSLLINMTEEDIKNLQSTGASISPPPRRTSSATTSIVSGSWSAT